ncbi:MAG: serine hydrolase, partial [Thermoanaerobaculia bacterium]
PPRGPLAELRRPQAPANRLPNWGWRGATGVALSANDLHRWWVALGSGSVLAPASVERMLAPQVEINAGLSGAYGWFQEKTPAGERALWTRGTDESGENAILLVLPDRELAIIGLAHSEATDDERDPITRRLAWEAVALLTATAPAPAR